MDDYVSGEGLDGDTYGAAADAGYAEAPDDDAYASASGAVVGEDAYDEVAYGAAEGVRYVVAENGAYDAYDGTGDGLYQNAAYAAYADVASDDAASGAVAGNDVSVGGYGVTEDDVSGGAYGTEAYGDAGIGESDFNAASAEYAADGFEGAVVPEAFAQVAEAVFESADDMPYDASEAPGSYAGELLEPPVSPTDEHAQPSAGRAYEDGNGAWPAHDEDTRIPPVPADGIAAVAEGYLPARGQDMLAVRRHMPASYAADGRLLADEDAEADAALAVLAARRKKRRRRRRAGIAVVLVALLAIGGFAATRMLAPSVESEAAEAPAMAEVVQEDFAAYVTSHGALEPSSSVSVSPEVDGIIAEVRVTEGASVAAGDVLFVLKNDALDKAVSDATAQLAAANDAASRAARAVSEAYDAYNAAAAAYDAGQIDDFDAAALNAAISSAEAARDEAKNAVTAAQEALTAANAQLAKRSVTSPIDGVVVSLGATVGTAVAAGSATSGAAALCTVASMTKMKVTVQVNEMDISSVAAGQQATVTFSALPGVTLAAMVESIATASTGSTDMMSYGSGGIVTYAVTLVVPEPDARLKPGMTASVTIQTVNVPGALVIPLAAVIEDGDVAKVEVVVDETTYDTEERAVALGARNGSEVVVEEGLQAGEMVLLSGSSAVSGEGFDDGETYADEDMLVA